jgi:hypothetical protein
MGYTDKQQAAMYFARRRRVQKIDAGVAPVITSVAAISNPEGTVLAHVLTANETVTWSLRPGGDRIRFEIFGGHTLRWLGNGVKNFSAPDDIGDDNVYNVTVRATDDAPGGGFVDQAIAVTVLNV